MGWQRVRGHDAVVRSLSSAYRAGRLGHAYLFVGPAGVGKFTLAKEFAKSLLCEAPGDGLAACDRCPSCILNDAGTHPDVITAGRPEDVVELPIATIRELCDKLALKPARGTRRVAILDDADELNDAAANAFLKTLEEPPPGSVLVLICAGETDSQLETILSRCQVVRFAPLKPDAVAAVLADAGVGDTARRDKLVRMAEGSPGQAMALDDDELWQFRETMLAALAGDKYDALALAEAWNDFVEADGKEAGQKRRRAGLVVRLLLRAIRDAIRVAHGADASDLADVPRLQALANRLGPTKLLALAERTLDASLQVDRKVQIELIVEALCDFAAQQRFAGREVVNRTRTTRTTRKRADETKTRKQ